MSILSKVFGNKKCQSPEQDKRAEEEVAEKKAIQRRLQTLQMQIEVIRRDYQ